MAKHPLDPAFAKLERAKTHISDLEAAIRTFVGAHPYRLTSQVNDQGTEEVWSIQVDPVPEVIECMAADAIHNLRTPIDKILAAGFRNNAIHTDNSALGRLKFPFSDHPNGITLPLEELGKHLTRDAIDFITKVEPYKGGVGRLLWAINTLDNRDKHRALTEPVKLSFSTTHHRTTWAPNGLILRMGSRRGRHMVPTPDARPGAWDMHQPVEALCPILRLSPASVSDYFLEFTSPHDDMEVFTTTPGTKVCANVQPSLNIAFSDVDGLEGEPAIKVLKMMCDAVESALSDFRKKFF